MPEVEAEASQSCEVMEVALLFQGEKPKDGDAMVDEVTCFSLSITTFAQHDDISRENEVRISRGYKYVLVRCAGSDWDK